MAKLFLFHSQRDHPAKFGGARGGQRPTLVRTSQNHWLMIAIYCNIAITCHDVQFIEVGGPTAVLCVSNSYVQFIALVGDVSCSQGFPGSTVRPWLPSHLSCPSSRVELSQRGNSMILHRRLGDLLLKNRAGVSW